MAVTHSTGTDNKTARRDESSALFMATLAQVRQCAVGMQWSYDSVI
ncbi:MAG: hypothetical protein ACRDCI_12575 [Plesiomonas shigelloides]